MLILRSMQNQDGGLGLHNMIETKSSNCMWINGWLDHHQTTISVQQNQDFLDVENKCNQWKCIEWIQF
jgi:hypothetical protein